MLRGVLIDGHGATSGLACGQPTYSFSICFQHRHTFVQVIPMSMQSHGDRRIDISLVVINEKCVFCWEVKNIEGPFKVLTRRFGVSHMARTENVVELCGVTKLTLHVVGTIRLLVRC
jgi:hypothetical protein